MYYLDGDDEGVRDIYLRLGLNKVGWPSLAWPVASPRFVCLLALPLMLMLVVTSDSGAVLLPRQQQEGYSV